MTKEFITFPQTIAGIGKSKDILSEVIKSADEIWWASAYLTSWPLTTNCIPKSSCTSCNIVVGSDFRISRKAALQDLHKWSKKAKANVFINEASGFHPKTIFWKKGNKYYALIGSSNLSVAAWSTNVELNVVINITNKEYRFLTKWFQDYVIAAWPMLDANWLEGYEESKHNGKPKTDPIKRIDERIKNLRVVELNTPRQQLRIYKKNKTKFEQLVKSCATAAINRDAFYETMWNLLYDSWYGTPSWCRSCKNAIWEEACRELVKIFDSPEVERDKYVKEAIDSLLASGNPTRGAWLTEILCHHYPYSYPLLNNPIKQWIKQNKISKTSNIDGSTYIRISAIMRNILKKNRDRFNNLGEMDHAIWEKIKKIDLKHRRSKENYGG